MMIHDDVDDDHYNADSDSDDDDDDDEGGGGVTTSLKCYISLFSGCWSDLSEPLRNVFFASL